MRSAGNVHIDGDLSVLGRLQFESCVMQEHHHDLSVDLVVFNDQQPLICEINVRLGGRICFCVLLAVSAGLRDILFADRLQGQMDDEFRSKAVNIFSVNSFDMPMPESLMWKS